MTIVPRSLALSALVVAGCASREVQQPAEEVEVGTRRIYGEIRLREDIAAPKAARIQIAVQRGHQIVQEEVIDPVRKWPVRFDFRIPWNERMGLKSDGRIYLMAHVFIDGQLALVAPTKFACDGYEIREWRKARVDLEVIPIRD